MNENETIEFEGRQYVNPDISRDEQMAFIDTMRDMQAQNNAQIATETHNLGTDVEPIRGGLSGSEEYWKGLYQTPQTNAAVANMKAVAQQTALNDALTNYQNMLQNRYNQAYRAYQKRAYKHNLSGGGGGGTKDDDEKPAPDVETDTGSEKIDIDKVSIDGMDAASISEKTKKYMDDGMNYKEAHDQAVKDVLRDKYGQD